MTGSTAKHVVLAAGGTGGHMFPAQALARELLNRGLDVSLITDRRGGGFGPELPQVETYSISAGGVAGASLVKKLKSALLLGYGYFEARRLIKRLGADTVVGFGGYPSVPTVFAGSHLKLRTILHEQNAVLGRANRLLAGRADAIATCFAQVRNLSAADAAKAVVTGNPVRAAIEEVGRRPYAVPGERDSLELLVVGGSLGAKVFNDLVPEAVCRLPAAQRGRLKVCQQVQGEALSAVGATYDGCNVRHTLAQFFTDVPERLAKAHLVISRAGASTVAEMAAAGRPAIMVPYPHATDDHQTYNAQALTEVGGGWLMPQSTLTAESLAERLQSLLADPALLMRSAGAAHAAAHRQAAKRLADVVCDRLEPNGGAKREEAA